MSPGASRGPVVVLAGGRLAPELQAELRRAAESAGRPLDLRLHGDQQGFAALLPEAEVVYGGLRAGQVALAPRLRWVHATSAGVDGLPLAELAAAGVVVTNARGQHADPMADHAFALLLALSRRLPRYVLAQREKRWAPADGEVLAGRRMGVLGYGAIGRAVARRAVAFGMEVWASRRHPAPDPLAARVLGGSRAEVLEILGACDDLVAVLPSTPETRGLLDAEAFAAMRPGARLVNLGRGDLIAAPALEAALRSGRLTAACDCLPGEPLPPDSTLWTAPNLLITPHVGGSHPDYARRGVAIFARNLARYCRGEPLDNLVDPRAGY
jgi:phosphoglycerate dehydrogenase-like enzyme